MSMSRWRWFALWLLSCGLLVACRPVSQPQSPLQAPASTVAPAPQLEKTLSYSLQRLPRAIVHVLRVPAQSQFVVNVGIAKQVQTVEEFATGSGAIAVLNGGFFDPANAQSTSSVIVQGQLAAQPEENARLMNNPELLPYLDRILNRSEFRQYRCGATLVYDITLRQALPPPNCQVEAAIGGGPQLLPNDTSVSEGFLDVQNGQVLRDALGRNQPNARSAVGIAQDGSVVYFLVSQLPESPAQSGLSLPELAAVMKQLGIEKGMNLDGGSSASMYYQGEVFYGKLSESGQPVSRPVKSVLMVQTVKNEKPGT